MLFLSPGCPGLPFSPRPGAFLAALTLTAASPGLLPPPAAAQSRPAANGHNALWFDATQLPSFTGVVERFLVNPRGQVDALLFREGPQVSFPPDVANELRRVAVAGRPLIVWGVRARSAPVITMLAFAPNAETTPVVLDRFYWRPSGDSVTDRATRLSISGTVRSPYYAPQGEVVGAILDDGSVIMLPRGAAALDSVRRYLRPGTRLTAEGPGYQGEEGRALLAEQLGEPGAMQPVPNSVQTNEGGQATGAPAPTRER
ncbi:MAG TPA: hypothetical protein VIL69_25250 [Roseomonas sp.]|jgi:hypothetical protein